MNQGLLFARDPEPASPASTVSAGGWDGDFKFYLSDEFVPRHPDDQPKEILWGDGVVTPNKPRNVVKELRLPEHIYFNIETGTVHLRPNFHRTIRTGRKLQNQENKNGTAATRQYGYLTVKNKFCGVLVHRALWGLYRTDLDDVRNIVDHINGRPLDNRPSNLRSVTPQENSLNQQAKPFWPPGIHYRDWFKGKKHKLWRSTGIKDVCLPKNFYHLQDAIDHRRYLIERHFLGNRNLEIFLERTRRAEEFRKAEGLNEQGEKVVQIAKPDSVTVTHSGIIRPDFQIWSNWTSGATSYFDGGC